MDFDQEVLTEDSSSPVIVSVHAGIETRTGIIEDAVDFLSGTGIPSVGLADEETELSGLMDHVETYGPDTGHEAAPAENDAREILEMGDYFWLIGGWALPGYCLEDAYYRLRTVSEKPVSETFDSEKRFGIIPEAVYTAPTKALNWSEAAMSTGSLAVELQKDESTVYEEGSGLSLNIFDPHETELGSIGQLDQETLQDARTHSMGLERIREVLDRWSFGDYVSTDQDVRFSMGKISGGEFNPRTDQEGAHVFFGLSDEVVRSRGLDERHWISRYRLEERPDSERSIYPWLHDGVFNQETYQPKGEVPPEGFIEDNVFYLEFRGEYLKGDAAYFAEEDVFVARDGLEQVLSYLEESTCADVKTGDISRFRSRVPDRKPA